MRNVIRHDRGLNQRENTPAGHRVHWSSRGRNGRGNSGFGASFIHCLSHLSTPPSWQFAPYALKFLLRLPEILVRLSDDK